MKPSFKTPSGIAAYTIGEGHPIIIIGGGPGISSRPYRTYLPPLFPRGYQAIFWDYAGLGESIRRENYSFEKDYADLENLINEMNLESFGLFGHSYGALSALRAAEQYKDRVSHLMLVGAAAAYAPLLPGILERKSSALNEEEAGDFISILEDVALGRITEESNRRYKALELKSQLYRPKPEVVREALEGVQFDLLVYSKNEDWLAEDLHWTIDKISSPTWVVTSTNDSIIPPVCSEPLLAIKNAQVTEFKNSGHWAFAEEPEEFSRELHKFLESVRPRLKLADL
jgi:non-heme chloroperoxidase